MKYRKPWSFCETPEEKCTMNYCDDNGCVNRKKHLVNDQPKTITTHENQPIQEFAKQVFKTVKEDWGSHNVDGFIEAFKKEAGR